MNITENTAGLLNIKEASNYIRQSVFTVRKLIRKKELAYYRLGHRTLRFKAEDLNQWLERQKVEPISQILQ